MEITLQELREIEIGKLNILREQLKEAKTKKSLVAVKSIGLSILQVTQRLAEINKQIKEKNTGTWIRNLPMAIIERHGRDEYARIKILAQKITQDNINDRSGFSDEED